jgi:hypothetical protein
MKNLTLIPLLILLSGNVRAECRSHEAWPDLSAWVCDIGASLAERDANSDLTRDITLITDREAIRAIRQSVAGLDDEVCRRFPVADYEQPLIRVQTHQGLQARDFAERRSFAAAEIWNTGAQGPMVACEAQILQAGDTTRIYIQYYYLKFGPVREGKHLIFRVVSGW